MKTGQVTHTYSIHGDIRIKVCASRQDFILGGGRGGGGVGGGGGGCVIRGKAYVTSSHSSSTLTV